MSAALATDISAERAFLGSIIQRPSVLDSVRAMVSPEDFSDRPHRLICDAIYAMHAASQQIDLVTICHRLASEKLLSDVGGEIYLAELPDMVASPSRAFEYARIIAECAIRRRLTELGHKLISEATDPAKELSDFTAAARVIEETIAGVRSDSGVVSPADFLAEYLTNLEQLQEGGGVIGIPTPWSGLNFYTAGLVPGEVTVFAGRAGTGKTAGALNIALHAAQNGHPVAILSLEMTRASLMNRFMSSLGEIDAQKFRTGRFSDDDWHRLYDCGSKLNGLPIKIFDKRDIKPSQLRALCKKLKRDFGLKLLIIDYLQLIKPEARSKSREVEVAEISRSIKTMALDLEIPVLLLAQLNRDAEKEARPRMGHLRESGAIEQDADVIVFIVPWRNSKDAPENVQVEFDVAKGRNNAVGSFELIYRRKYLTFADMAYRHDPGPMRGNYQDREED